MICYKLPDILYILKSLQTPFEKAEFINRQLSITKRLLDYLENTEVAKSHGQGYWAIYTSDETLSQIIEETMEGAESSEERLRDCLEGIVVRLKEAYFYLLNEFNYHKNIIEIQPKNTEVHKQEKKVHGTLENLNKEDRVRERLPYETAKAWFEKLNLDGVNFRERIKKSRRIGNQDFVHTQGKIIMRLEKMLGKDFSKNEKKVLFTHIKKYRKELGRGNR